MLINNLDIFWSKQQKVNLAFDNNWFQLRKVLFSWNNGKEYCVNHRCYLAFIWSCLIFIVGKVKCKVIDARKEHNTGVLSLVELIRITVYCIPWLLESFLERLRLNGRKVLLLSLRKCCWLSPSSNIGNKCKCFRKRTFGVVFA